MTKIRTVYGNCFDGKRIISLPITVRVTVDRHGKTLSLSDDNGACMFVVALEGLEDLIRSGWEEEDT